MESENANTQPQPQVNPTPVPPAPAPSYIPPPPPPAPVVSTAPGLDPEAFYSKIKASEERVAALEKELNEYKSRHSDSEKTFQSQNQVIEKYKNHVAKQFESRYNALKDAGIEEFVKAEDYKDDPYVGIIEIDRFEQMTAKLAAKLEEKYKADTTANGTGAPDNAVSLTQPGAAARRVKALINQGGLPKPPKGV